MSFFSFLLSNIYNNKILAPFWPLLTNFGHKICLAPFELFGWKFDHLAALGRTAGWAQQIGQEEDQGGRGQC